MADDNGVKAFLIRVRRWVITENIIDNLPVASGELIA